MSKQIFGHSHKQEKQKNTDNENYEYKPLEEHISPQKFFLIVVIVIVLIIEFFISDKERILYCDIPKDYCEVRVDPFIGSKEIIPVYKPSEIKDFSVSTHHRRRGHYTSYMYMINDKGERLQIAEEHDKLIFGLIDSFIAGTKYDKFKRSANELKVLIENKNTEILKYDLLHSRNKI